MSTVYLFAAILLMPFGVLMIGDSAGLPTWVKRLGCMFVAASVALVYLAATTYLAGMVTR